MKWKMNKWKIATLITSIILMSAAIPELMAVGAFVQAMGLEFLLPLFEVQLIAIIGVAYRAQIKPILIFTYNALMKLDSNFFIPNRETVAQQPAIALHVIPGLVSCYRRVIMPTSLY